MVRTPGAASISTSSASPATSSSGLARRIPRELPILISFARTTTPHRIRDHIVATLEASAHPLLWITLPLSCRQEGIAIEADSTVAYPLKGLFEGVASPQATFADLRLICRPQVTSASFLTLALNFRPKAVTTFRMVSKLGLRSPDKAL